MMAIKGASFQAWTKITAICEASELIKIAGRKPVSSVTQKGRSPN